MGNQRGSLQRGHGDYMGILRSRVRSSGESNENKKKETNTGVITIVERPRLPSATIVQSLKVSLIDRR